MAKSMTGYGRGKDTLHGRDITVEVRAVNHRYLDSTIKFPRMYGYLEDAVKSRLTQTVNRGKVDIYISIESGQTADTRIGWNPTLAEGYLRTLTEMSRQLGLKNDVSVMSLARWPEIFTAEKVEVDEAELTADVLSVMETALESFEQMRLREGQQLKNDMLARLDSIAALVEKIEERSPKTVEEYRAKLLGRMQEVLQSTDIDPQRILTEAAVFADRVAVAEETVRLRSHMEQMRQMLEEAVPVGRKLDFLVQEFNREANTIGSKGNDLTMARLVVDLKAEIEKIREQVQNVE